MNTVFKTWRRLKLENFEDCKEDSNIEFIKNILVHSKQNSTLYPKTNKIQTNPNKRRSFKDIFLYRNNI